MNFDLNPEQSALAESVERFTSREYTVDARMKRIESGEGLSLSIWQTFAELGWLGAGLSEEAGGFGGGPLETAIIMEGFGRALVIDPFLPVAILALQTVAASPGSQMRDELIGAIVAGESFPILAHNESIARGDSDIAETRYQSGTISGTKSMTVGAPFADKLIVSARSADGIGLYVVDPAAPGLSQTRYRLLDNQHAADIVFDQVPVLDTLVAPGAGEQAIATGVAHALVGICAEAVGAMDAAIRITKEYIVTRQQFGVTLGSFQAVQHRMAEMLVEMELSRSILYQGIAAINHGDAQRRHALSAMKAIVSSAATYVGRYSIQLHGGIGMTEEYSIGHYFRRLHVIASQFGGESLHLKKMAAAAQPFWGELDLAANASSREPVE